MSTESALAIYAAALSSALAAFEVAKWISSRRTRVRIEAQPAVARATPHDTRNYQCFYVDVINDSDHLEHVAWIFVERQESDGEWVEDQGVGENKPIPARGRISYTFAEQEVADDEGADVTMLRKVSSPYRFRVVLGTGRDVVTEPRELPDWLGNAR